MNDYYIGIAGMWILTDGLFSIAIATRYYPAKQSWLYDHSIRLVRCAVGIVLIVVSA